MGLLDFLDNYNELEKQLLEHYTDFFTSMGLPGKKTAKEMLDKAIEESKKLGTYNLPQNFGDIILGKEKAENQAIENTAEYFRKLLPAKRAEGVKDEDIRWWWNLNDVERFMMFKIDDFYKGALFMNEIQEGKTPDQAGITVWKFHPTYTIVDPNKEPENKPFKLKREDYPLPAELKDRVNVFIEEKAKIDSDGKYKKEIESSSTFNALIRKEMKAGKIK